MRVPLPCSMCDLVKQRFDLRLNLLELLIDYFQAARGCVLVEVSVEINLVPDDPDFPVFLILVGIVDICILDMRKD